MTLSIFLTVFYIVYITFTFLLALSVFLPALPLSVSISNILLFCFFSGPFLFL